MNTLKKSQQFLAKPFPQEESIFETLKIVAVISVFVVAFLYVFKPFGIHLQESGVFSLCLGFGLVTFFASVIYEFIVVRIFKIKGDGARFTFGIWIVYFLGVMLFISLANFIFVRLVLFDDIQWELFPYMMRGTFAIGIFPVIFVGAMALIRGEKKYQTIATEINHQPPRPTELNQPNDLALFNIPISEIRYVEAMQNYIKIGHVAGDGQLKEHTERATLKSISNDALGGLLVRCHRSFLVNRDAITATAGNAQGLLLSLSDCDKQVPVSRSYISIFKDH